MEKRPKLTLLALSLISGCQSYQANPLTPGEILEKVEQSRRELVVEDKPPGLSDLAHRLLTHCPALLRSREEYKQMNTLAGIPTPLPNPSLGLGTMVGTKLDPGQSSKALQPLIEFGFTIPLNGRLKKADSCRQARAAAAHVDLITTHRNCYLRLRTLWTELAMAEMFKKTRKLILNSNTQSLTLSRRLVAAGKTTALDIGLMELAVTRARVALTGAKHHNLEIRQQLARFSGLVIKNTNPGSDTLPDLKGKLPPLKKARQLLLANHPDLCRLRAKYAIAEMDLRLEIAKQYPDLDLGTSFGGDPGADKKVWGLSIGITLPIFDRNQQAIAAAAGERQKIRTAYAARLSEALADLEHLHAASKLAQSKLALLRDHALPRARANLNLSKRAIRAGESAILDHLLVLKTQQEITLESLTAEAELRRIYGELETIIGLPLFTYPGEPPAHFPTLSPPTLKDKESPTNNLEPSQ